MLSGFVENLSKLTRYGSQVRPNFVTMNQPYDQETLKQLALACCRSLCRAKLPELTNQTSMSDLLIMMKEQSVELHQQFILFREALETDAFLRRDYELRTKLRDIWEFQTQQSGIRLQLMWQQFTSLAKSKGIILDEVVG